ncbi:MAG TPA: putative LPS assembly protein LptD [Acidobacteriota bacterium]|nr:putative LPS assembly protein LptD [Acidobacteriota bacterium]
MSAHFSRVVCGVLAGFLVISNVFGQSPPAPPSEPQSPPGEKTKITSPVLPVEIPVERDTKSDSASEKEKRKQRRQLAAPQEKEAPTTAPPPGDEQQVLLEADEQRKDGDIYTADGYVNIYYQGSRLQADHAVYNEKTGDAVATGNVVYDPAPRQRITATQAELNIRTKKGTFVDATGYTDQNKDGTLIEFVADRVDKTGFDTYVLYNARVTSCCEDAVPLWTISSGKTDVTVNKRITSRNSLFRIRGVPIFYFPFISLPINRRQRQSGFLIPSTGSATNTGRFFRNTYYQTLGESADVLLRGDVYTQRGFGVGATFRARTSDDSYIKAGSYTVFDRVLGEKESESTPDQGGTLFFAQGVQHFPHGFLGVVDINFTSNLDFRSIFANDVEEAFNPEKRSQLYLNNNFRNFTFNALAESRTTRVSVPVEDGRTQAVDVNIRRIPSFEFSVFPTPLKNLPIYLSGEASLSGLRREETINSGVTFETPTFVQRLDAQPRLTFPFASFAGWAITPSVAVRSTYYSNTFDPKTALTPRAETSFPIFEAGRAKPGTPVSNLGTSGRSLFRNFVDFSLDIRPPALEKIFYTDEGKPRLKHVIEPYLTYRRVAGIDDFGRMLRFDVLDTFTNTNELEYALVNRFLVPRRLGGKKEKKNGKKDKSATGDKAAPQTEDDDEKDDEKAESGQSLAAKSDKGEQYLQAREVLSIALTQKYFFDPTFGGALVEGERNQIVPIQSLSGFNYGGRPRRFSPLNLKVRYSPMSSMFADVRLDYDTRENQVRGFGVAAGVSRPNFRLQQRWYYSNRLEFLPNQFEPGTFAGNQIISAIDVGNDTRGLYSGFNISYDFSKAFNPDANQFRRNGLIRSGGYVGYAFRCASIELNYRSINTGVATSGQLTFSFTLRGLGTFGTDQFGDPQNR